jgi:uncharacterized repeat protein (TIGR01451 family)
MQTWLRSSSRSTKGRKSTRKNRRSRAAWRSNFGALNFQVERLEDRVLLSISPTGATVSATEGVAFSGTVATFTSTDPVGTDYSAVISWGDLSSPTTVTGTIAAGMNAVTGTHVYVDELVGSNNLAVALSDAVGSTATATGTVTVNEGDTLTAGAPFTIAATQGAAFSSTTLATFTDAYTGNTASDFTASVNWGDGTSSTLAGTTLTGSPITDNNGTITVSGSHAYAGTAARIATVTLADNAPGTASATATTTVNLSAAPTTAPSVSLTNRAPNSAFIGAPITHTITLTNGSTANAATSVAFTDQLDTDEAFISASDTDGTALTFSNGQVTGTIASIAALGSDTVTIVTVPTAAATVTNTASISIPSGNSGATVNATATTTVANSTKPASVGVAENGPVAGINGGGKIFYTVTLTNFGTAAATNVAFSDQLDPNEVLFTVSDALGTPFSVANGVISGTVASIGAASSDAITIAVTPNTAAAAGSVTDTAAVGVPGGNNGAATNSLTTAIGTGGAGDVTISKTGPTATSSAVGSPVTYTVTLTNKGAAAANNVWIMDPLEPNVAVLSAADSAGSTFALSNSGNVSANVSSIAAGASDTATIVVVPTLLNGAPLANAAYVGVSGGELSTVSNVSTAANITVTAAPTTAPDLTVVKTGPATANVGDLVTYTVTIADVSKTNAASNVHFSDPFSNLTILSVSDAAGSSFSVASGATSLTGVISGSIASIGAGNTDTITIAAIPGLPAGVTIGTAADPISIGVPGGNSGTVTTKASSTAIPSATAPTANVTITNTSVQASVAVGDQLTTTVTLTNAGTSAVSNVAFVDSLPGQVFFTASDTDKTVFTLNPSTGQLTGTIASLAGSGVAATDTITIVTVPTTAPGSVATDTATIGISGGDQAANSATEAVPVIAATSGASVSVAKNAPPTASVGAPVTDTVTLTNAAAATTPASVAFVDSLGTNVSSVTASDGQAGDRFTYSTATGQVTGTVSAAAFAGAAAGNGGAATVTVVFTPTTVGTLTDTATVAIGNGNSGTPVSSAATTAVSGVTVTKSAPGTSTVGDMLLETITVTNNGSTAATNLAFSDALGTSGYNFVSAGDTLGTALSLNATTGGLTGTIASLAASGTDTVTLRLIPTAAGTLSDTASVTASGVTSMANGSSTVSAGATPGNVSIKKSVPTSGTVGDLVSDTITLTNAAAAATTAGIVTLFDTLGAGQSFISASDSVGSAFSFDAASNTVIGFMNSIAPSGTDTVTINVVSTAAGTITDTANVAVTGGNLATTISGTGSTTVAAAGQTKVNAAKTAPATAIVGSVVTETVTITNAGSSAATNVAFTDNFFAGNLELLSATDTAGSTLTFNSNTDTVTGTIASLAASGTTGNVDTVTVTYIPVDTTTVTDTASITISGGNSGTTSSSVSTTIKAALNTAPTIAVAKSAPANAPSGSLLTTTVTLTNNTSPAAAATNVAFVDQLSPGQIFVAASDTGGNTFALSNGQVTGTVATIGTGASNTDTVKIVTLVTGAPGSSTGDTAIIGVSGGNQSTPVAFNSVSVTAGTANVVVSKSAPETGTIDTPVTDTVTLNNKGSVAVTNVSFVDMLGANVSSVSASDAGGDTFAFAKGQVTGTIASLATGTTTVSVVYTPTAAGVFRDTAAIGLSQGNTGTASAAASTTVNALPVLGTSAGTLAATEGLALSTTVATFTDPNGALPLSSYSTSVDWGDGTSKTAATITGPDAGGVFTVVGAHTYADEKATAETITVVIGRSGSPNATVTDSATVADASLSASASAVSATEGSTFSGTVATFTDANPAGTSSDYTAIIDWSDKSPLTTVTGSQMTEASGKFTVPASHVYAEEGTFTMTLTISDVGGATATLKPVATVGDATLSATASAVSATEGSTFSGTVASFTDGNPGAASGDFTAVVDWGDKSASTTISGSQITEASGTFSVPGSHVYAEEGTYTMTVTVTDAGGATATVKPVATVGDATLSATAAAVSTTEGSTFSGTVATFSDGNPLATASDFSATIDWGDGTTTSGSVSAAASGFQVTGSHTYATSGGETITVAVSDVGGSSATITTSATVAASGTPHQQYVMAVYEDVLGRAPDSGGLAYWAQQLDSGVPVSSVAQAIGHSAEYYANFVIKPDYLKLLGRAADAGGVQYWTTQMQNGLTDQQLEAQFAASDEFFKNAGGTTNAVNWIDAVYKLLLGRTADPGGETYWSGKLASLMSTESAEAARLQVALGIAGSQENNTNLINQDYFHYLGRAADPGGLTYWLQQFADGATNEDVIAGFTGSAEYYKEHTAS